MIEVLVILTVYIFGWAYLRIFLVGLDCGVMFLAAFPAGTAIWMLSTIIVLVLHIPYSPWVPFGLCGGAAFIANVFYGPAVQRPELIRAAIIALPICIFSAIFQYFELTIIASDSLFMLAMGKQISHHGGFTDGISALLASFSSFIAFTQMVAFYFGIDYFKSILPLHALSTLGLYVALGRRILAVWWPFNSWIQIGLPILAGATLVSTYPYAWGSFYLKTAPVYGFSIFVGCTAAWLAITENQPKWLGLMVIAIFGTLTLRVESGLTTLPLLVVAVSLRTIDIRTRAILIAVIGLTFGAWYALIIIESFGRGMFSVYQLFGIGAAPGLFGAATALILWPRLIQRTPNLHRVVEALPPLMISGLVAFIVLYGMMKPEITINALYKYACFIGDPALGSTFFWGGMCALTLLMTFIRGNLQDEKIFVYVIMGYILVVIAIAIQVPWKHCGSHDSTNRILVHIMPTLVFYMLLRFVAPPNNTRQSKQ